MSEGEYMKSGGQNERLTIGYITSSIHGGSLIQWTGVVDAAEKYGVNLICFPGYCLHDPREFYAQANVLYDLVGAENVDGIISWASSIGNYAEPDDLVAFHERYRPLPMVSIGKTLEGIPSLLMDSYNGMREVVSHLIEVHGCRRLAFIRGPEGHFYAQERYRAYTETLEAYGIPFDPDLVTQPAVWGSDVGRRVTRLLLDAQKLRPGTDLDAIVAANDDLLLGALEILCARGIRVPEDVAVAGFDDRLESRASSPPLTTVVSPFYEVGYRSVETLLALIEGKQVPEEESLLSKMVVRRSCGCLDPAVTQAAAGPVTTVSEPLGVALAARREQILSEMVQAVETPEALPASAEQLLDTLVAEIEDGAPGAFLAALDEVLQPAVDASGEIVPWNGALSVLRRHVLPYVGDGDARSRVEDLLQQARLVVTEVAGQVSLRQRLQEQTWEGMLRGIGQVLSSVTDVAGLADVLAEELPGLGIRGEYLSLYEDPKSPIEWSRLVLASDTEGRITVGEEARRFPSRRLTPEGVLRHGRRYTLVAEPLYFRERQLGFVLFEVGPRESTIYDALCSQISSALQATMLVQQVEERSRALQEANYALQRRAIQIEASAEVGRASTSIFDIDELLKQTATLISDRFGFYHVGIFLMDAAGEWAILQEATGEVGAQMKAQGHRLAVGDTSMVGWTAAHREARIALDVGEEAVRFAHPLLPHTRSEMTLPLVVGDQLLGVLNVQSTEEAAFDQEDVRTLQGMANQVAIAIQNARRMADEGALLEATSPLYRTSRLLTTATTRTEVADAIVASVGETGADGCIVVEFEFSPAGEPEALLYLGVWRRDREPQFQTGLRLPIAESPFPLEMVSTLWAVPNVDQDDRLPRSARVVFQATGAKALVNIPLRSGERVIGQVVVIRATPGPFSEAALRLYEVLSDQAAVALERAELLEEAQQRAEREQQTRQMIDHIRRAADLEHALSVAAEDLSRAMEVPHVSINLSVSASGQE
jgi:DNA-binding LacI/PurR family transcriptional regulator/GAF domain-containing protein